MDESAVPSQAPSSARLLDVAHILHKRLSHWHMPDVLEIQPYDFITVMDLAGDRFRKLVRARPDPPQEAIQIFAFDQGPLVPVDEPYPETWEPMEVPKEYEGRAGIATRVPSRLTDRSDTWQWMGVFWWNLDLFPSHPAVEYVRNVFETILDLPMCHQRELPPGMHPKPERPYYLAGRQQPTDLLDRLVSATEKLHDLVLTGQFPLTPNEQTPACRGPRLVVDLSRLNALDQLTGESFELPSVLGARWLKVLADHESTWITAPSLKDYDSELDGVRTDRLLKSMPEALAKRIKTSKQLGSRLVMS